MINPYKLMTHKKLVKMGMVDPIVLLTLYGNII